MSQQVVEFLESKAARTEQALGAFLDESVDASESLMTAIRYSLLGAGKRLRPALTLGAAELVCGEDRPALPSACAIEMIHTYSLIHDDLPAMDNDDLRRGKPTSHKVFGEATAILAGDALLTLAFEMLARGNRMELVTEVACAAGVGGMAGGQQLDLEGEGRPLDLAALRRIHAWKTGALIRCSVRCGALSADADARALASLTTYGEQLGLAFQIADDILNVTGTKESLGKPVGSDASRHKSTYPALVGLEEARRLADRAAASAVAALADFGPDADLFRLMARFVVERDK